MRNNDGLTIEELEAQYAAEMDRMPIETQLATVEENIEAISASVVLIQLMRGRLFAAWEFMTAAERERLERLVDRIVIVYDNVPRPAA